MAGEIVGKGFTLLILLVTVSFAAKIRDIATVEGNRSNYLVGYGLVVGLKGTGDGKSTLFTVRSIANMLQRMGVSVDPRRMTVKNVAAVMVTAKLPPYAKPGMRIDVEVSSIGDAKSLEGGTLLLTPLVGPDGQIYALAQGQVVVSGYEARGAAARQVQNVPTVGRIPNGAIVERGLSYPQDVREINLYLDNASFSLAKKIQDIINARFQAQVAQAVDASTVRLKIPEGMDMVSFLAQVEDLDIDVPAVAKVVIDSRSGTVLLGGDVTIAPVSVTVGTLTVTVKEAPEVVQPPPLSRGETVVVPRTELKVEEKERRIMELRGATVSQLVESLNRIGATPREIIAILQAMKAAGALRAKLEVL
ncbi:flagellar P-ring protein [Thermocrinis albus DSM 14484]|uniref:Flagellar P-ring protein n=1 Tax=Thermocrinis albus (strain DSM 14484 / JCM 11386 / HI 11/12) TaxID=638303 RepID=D3SM96_THEAH|nr:flagellar basal body P-ring protein FlgI [Thermocrinis albus]ADC89876.1 flagellar P-ring protein [Thermocrinis albus DSM 14484]